MGRAPAARAEDGRGRGVSASGDAEDFVYEIPVRFADVDRAGILYYPRFLNYFHIAFEEFFGQALGIPYVQLIEKERIGFPMRHMEVDFRGPLAYGDAARVAVRVTRVGRTSMSFHYEVTSCQSGKLITIADATVVCVDLIKFQPFPVPEPYRSLLERRVRA